MARIKLTDKQKKIREQRVIDMYQRGAPQMVICSELHISCNEIRRIVKAAGVYIKGRASILNKKSPEGYKRPTAIEAYQDSCITREIEKNMEEAVRPEHIAMIRRIVKPGDVLKIRTRKGMSNDVDDRTTVHGVVRDAVVIGVKSPVSCLVRLIGSGVMESVMWRDIYVSWRDGKEVIEQE